VDANQAFLRCGAVALSRQVTVDFPETFNLAEAVPLMAMPTVRPSKDLLPKSPATSSSGITSNSGDKRGVFLNDESTPGLAQRLNIEGILKSL
jgi:hypothetical protein